MEPVLSEARFAAFIGIDWADVKHDVCLQAVGSKEFEFSTLAHTPEAIAAWTGSLHQRFRGKPVAICVERDKGPLVYALREYDLLVVFPVNPLTPARFREAFATSRAKDDPSDARLQLELLLKHRHRLHRARSSRRLVGDKVRLISRLTSVLKNYYPQVPTWFKDGDTAQAGLSGTLRLVIPRLDRGDQGRLDFRCALDPAVKPRDDSMGRVMTVRELG